MIRLAYQYERPDPAYVEASKLAAEFWEAHPRLSFEPRTLAEHSAHQEYTKLFEQAKALENKTTTVEGTGTYLQASYRDGGWFCLVADDEGEVMEVPATFCRVIPHEQIKIPLEINKDPGENNNG